MSAERGWHPGLEEGFEGSTIDESASKFRSMLSDETEDQLEGETQQEHVDPAPGLSDDETDAETEQDVDPQDESDETDEDAEEEPVVEEPVLHTVVIDGKEEKVTLEEALKGYSRTKDYTQKTQATAEERKALAAEKAAVAESAKQYAAHINQLVQVIDQTTPKEPNWAERRATLSAEDYLVERDAWYQHEREMAALKAEQAAANAKVYEERTKAQQAHIQSEREKLLEAIPEWKKPEVAKAERVKLSEYAASLGITEERLQQVDDHRLFVIMRKAMQFDQLQAKKPKAEATIAKVKAARPGTPTVTAKKPMSPETKAHLRLAKSGSIQDAARAFRTQMGD